MMGKQFDIRCNPVTLTSISSFARVDGRLYEGKKDVYFLRYIGIENETDYIEQIFIMDKELTNRMKQYNSGYIRTKHLMIPDNDQIKRVTNYYENWHEKQDITRIFDSLKIREEPNLIKAFYNIWTIFSNLGEKSESMKKNFFIKFLFWIEQYLSKLFLEERVQEKYPKFVFTGSIQYQEYLFLYFLVLLGCDVLYLNPVLDCSLQPSLLLLSACYEKTNKKALIIPDYIQQKETVSNSFVQQNCENSTVSIQSTKPVKIAKKEFIHPKRSHTNRQLAPPVRQSACMVLEYTELAKLSSSIVMIEVYDQNGECFKTGSGVVIAASGYIITNFHVVSEGTSYGIRMEEEEQIYLTDELIKYHREYDLAILRINKTVPPITIYQGQENLVRGEKVVAIGSPFGLFNSVSDGIISGFREINKVQMIQFSAPTSPGSSGGALLNLYGELIGISTAMLADGQNINLAVNYKIVYNFSRNFLS